MQARDGITMPGMTMERGERSSIESHEMPGQYHLPVQRLTLINLDGVTICVSTCSVQVGQAQRWLHVLWWSGSGCDWSRRCSAASQARPARNGLASTRKMEPLGLELLVGPWLILKQNGLRGCDPQCKGAPPRHFKLAALERALH